MAKFRKKPVTVEAMQFDGTVDCAYEIVDWSGKNINLSRPAPTLEDANSSCILSIPTLEGTMTASKGDWVIRGVKGELYPCKPDVFEATYDAVADNEVSIPTKRGVLAIEVGDDDWEPTEAEMKELVDLFKQADLDPLGSFIALRRGIRLKEIDGSPLLDKIVVSVGSPDWSPSSEQLSEVVTKLMSGSKNHVEQTIRECLSRENTSTDEFVRSLVDALLHPKVKEGE